MIYQTTIQHFFQSNGIDYAMAMDVNNDIIISSTHPAAMGKHNEIVEKYKRNGYKCQSSYDAESNWDITRIDCGNGRRTIIITMAKELNR